MDSAVDQTMGRTTDEKGADKAAALRRSQGRERNTLQNDISKAQKEITGLQEQRAPVASQARKVDAEVGPIKYIAALVYGDNPDANVLERAVRWVIILIVIVFDPLALTLLLAATKAFEWEQGTNVFTTKRKDNPLEDRSKEDFDAINKLLKDAEEKEQVDNILQQGIANSNAENNQPLAEKKLRWSGFAFPMLSIFSKKEEPEPETVEQLVIDNHIDEPIKKEDLEKESMRRWKEENPSNTIKRQEKLKELGAINDVPWHSPKYNMGLQADNEPHGPTGEVKGFGTSFPVESNKGDMFLRVDQLPTQLYKFNGIQWIVVDKGLTDNYAYDDAYIDHLIDKIDSGEYDLDLLSDTERDAIEAKLKR
jgi:hypothetical protein